MKRFIRIVVAVLAMATPVPAAILHVPGDAGSIQAGVALAANGDMILVGPGSYAGALVDGKSVAIVAEEGPCRTFITSPCETNDGFAIQNCTGTEVRGFWIQGMPQYGVRIWNTVDAWVHENVVVGSASSGIDVPFAYPSTNFRIEYNTVAGNVYGVLVDGSPLGFVEHNVVWGNSSSDIGCFFDASNLEVSCNLVGAGGGCIAGDNTVHGSDPFLGLAGWSDLRLGTGLGIPATCGAVGAPLECQGNDLFTISGHLSSSCGMPMNGVTIDEFDAEGALVETAVTGSDGAYALTNVAGGSYVVQVVTPLGFEAVSPVSLAVMGDVVQDFSLDCIELFANPRSLGYWKHNVALALAGRRHGAQESGADLGAHADLIFHHFYENLSNPIDVLNVTYRSGPVPLDLATMDATLNLHGNVPMLRRAEQQDLVLLLNVASGRLATWMIGSLDDRTVSQAIVYVASLLRDGNTTNDELAKNIAEAINDGRRVPAGVIPTSVPNIAFKGEETTSPGRHGMTASPTPFNPRTTLTFVMEAPGRATLDVYDVGGRRCRRLLHGWLGLGECRVTWDGRDDAGRGLPSGVYVIVRRTGAGESERVRVTLLE